MIDFPIEQALYLRPDGGEPRCQARSAGFRDEWQPEAERLCVEFGVRPPGVACPEAVFARPFAKEFVVIAQVADQGAEPPNLLAFRLLVVPRKAYREWIADPFAVADRFPPAWHSRGTLPALAWSAELMPPRGVASVQAVLQRPDGPVLLGGVQALVDGARLFFKRPAPEPGLVRGLWTLLPTANRAALWPATFAFGNALGFDVIVVPRAAGNDFANYLTEQQAGDYPQGRYELALQVAAEAGDHAGLQSLLARRSSAQTLRLGWLLVVVAIVLAAGMKLLLPAALPERKAAHPPADSKEHKQPDSRP